MATRALCCSPAPPMSVRRLVLPFFALASGLLCGLPTRAAEPQAAPIIRLSGLGESLEPDLRLRCPQGSSAEPAFQNAATGQVSPIANPQLRAIAIQACRAGTLGAGETGRVDIVNRRDEAIYVGFTGAIDWGADCTRSGTGVKIAARSACHATVASSDGSTRFCASTGRVPNCAQAQDNHQTLVETTFQTAAQCAFLGKSGTCVWYDISIIPTGCTDALWKANECAEGGGASYNLPVALACTAQPTYRCRGPTGTTFGPQKYPKNCGNPDATCVGNSPKCVNAYFYPMYDPPENKYAPNSVCPGGATLTVWFLAGS